MTAGDVILLDFPFSDLSGSKLRPAVILADVGRGDYIACQITSNPNADAQAVLLSTASFSAGGLRKDSFARPGKVFTAHRSIIARRVGTLTDTVKENIKDVAIELIRHG